MVKKVPTEGTDTDSAMYGTGITAATAAPGAHAVMAAHPVVEWP